jgi:hypothetical protein
MLPALITQLTAAGCAFEEPNLDQIWFNHILNRLALFRQSGGKRFDTGWTTWVVIDGVTRRRRSELSKRQVHQFQEPKAESRDVAST